MHLTPHERVDRILRLWRVGGSPDRILAEAENLADGGIATGGTRSDAWQGVVVTKGPHAGGRGSLVEIIARVLAYGARVVAVEHRAPSDAGAIARSLYPDVGERYGSLRLPESTWVLIDELFDRPEFIKIFGVPYSRELVMASDEVRRQSNLSTSAFAQVWATGRRPISATEARRSYGPEASALIEARGGALYDWYRGVLPVGIHKVESGTMAFALRHSELCDGRPVIAINGQFTLLAECFENLGRGSEVITVEIDGPDAFAAFRSSVVGHSDVPRECELGSIRRDALDGWFGSDSDVPVTPWANVVHASDGYISGLIESIQLSHYHRSSFLAQLSRIGYSEAEIRTLVISDPAVESDGGRERLTQITKMKDLATSLSIVHRLLPPAGAAEDQAMVERFLAALYAESSATPPGQREAAFPEPLARRASAAEVTPLKALARPEVGHSYPGGTGGVGILVPLAGSGGRFGGYDVPEGTGPRLKPLLPLFDWRGTRASALDIRVDVTQDALGAMGRRGNYFFSGNHSTAAEIRKWADRRPDLSVRMARVPELLRFEVGGEGGAMASRVVRGPAGEPLTKPLGSFGLLWSAFTSGTLQSWADLGIEVAVAANADDVGFVVDPAILALFDSGAGPDAVVCVLHVGSDDLPSKGGLLRYRLGRRGWSAYIEENAVPLDRNEFFNTNQIYFRLSSLIHALSEASACQLPVYLEEKTVALESREIRALHAYRPFCDVLRLLDDVRAVAIAREPAGRQQGGYCPLKRPDDVERAQRLISLISARGA